MTDVRKSRRGGKRVGAGRPKGSKSARVTVKQLADFMSLPAFNNAEEIALEASEGAALELLVRVLLIGRDQRARVLAAREIIMRGYPRDSSAWVFPEAKKYARHALAVLKKISVSCDNEAVRVEACSALLELCVPE